MLKTSLIHGEILSVLARAGHHSKILIADGNYPASAKKGPNAVVVSMNLAPGVISCEQALKALIETVPVDAVNTMGIPPDDSYAQSGEPPVWADYRRVLADAGHSLELKPIEKWAFYDAVNSEDHVLTIQTGDQSLWANVLLTMGCRTR